MATPNLAGTLMAAIIPLVAMGFVRGRPRWQAWGSAAAFSLLVAGIAMTGSRAALLAAMCGIGLTAVAGILSWSRTAIMITVLGCGFLLWIPAGVRLAGVGADPSILDRLSLWSAALALFHDGAWEASPVPILERWYLPPQCLGRFDTCLNDGLNLLFAVGFCAWTSIVAVTAALLHAGSHPRRLLGTAGAIGTAMLTCLLIGAMFQGHSSHAAWRIAVAICLLIIVTAGVRARPPAGRLSISLLIGCAAAVVVSIVLVAVSKRCAQQHPWEISRDGGMEVARRRGASPVRRMAFLAANADERMRWARDWAPSALAGSWEVILPLAASSLPWGSAEGCIWQLDHDPPDPAAHPHLTWTIAVDPERVPPDDGPRHLVVIWKPTPFCPRHELQKWAKRTRHGMLVDLRDESQENVSTHMARWIHQCR